MAEQAEHGVGEPFGVFDAFAKHHEAPAFAVHRAGLSEPPYAGSEGGSHGERARVEFGIAPGKPADVAIVPRALVGEGRERHQLRSRVTPLRDQMRVEEGEGGVSGDGDAPAGRGQGSRARGDAGKRRRGRDDAVDVQRSLHDIGKPIDVGIEIGMFVCLDEPEMALRQRDRRVAHDRAEDR